MKPKRKPKFPKKSGIVQGPLVFFNGHEAPKYIIFNDLEFFKYLGTKDRAKLLEWFIAMHEYLCERDLQVSMPRHRSTSKTRSLKND